MASELYIGLMSGTSADAIDAVLVDFGTHPLQLVAHHSLAFDRSTRATIQHLAHPGTNEIDRMGALDTFLGERFAEASLQLLQSTGAQPAQIAAIGSHGQTLRHRPPDGQNTPFSLQVGDPNIIAQRTGITTVADFRRRDLAAGGQGAPLVPAFHSACFASTQHHRAIVNIGGIANLTWLDRQGTRVIGFDTGPGNGLMDAWINRGLGKPYDESGAWAASGTADPTLLQRLLTHPYFDKPAPKSTGPEEFHLDWLNRELDQLHQELKPEDVQATLLSLTAHSIARSVTTMAEGQPAEVFLCGGGAYNRELQARLQDQLGSHHPVDSTQALGLNPEWVEATAFAWLARRTIKGMTGNVPSVTGARQPCVLGAIYPGHF